MNGLYSPLNGEEILDLVGEAFAKLLTEQLANNERLAPHLVIHNPVIKVSFEIQGITLNEPIVAKHEVVVETTLSAEQQAAVAAEEPKAPETIVAVEQIVADEAPDRLREQITATASQRVERSRAPRLLKRADTARATAPEAANA